MHAATKVLAAALLLGHLAGCGSSLTDGADASTDGAASTDAALDVAETFVAPVDTGVDTGPPAPFPAFHPVLPQVANRGGPVIAAPRIVPVFFSTGDAGTYPFESDLRAFLAAYMASPEWIAQVGEYGVGAGTVAAPVHTTGVGLSSTTVDTARLHAWTQTQLRNGAFGTSTPSDIVVLFLDGARQGAAGAGASLCHGIGGYHESVTDESNQPVALAVIPDCNDNLEVITHALSHELVEAVSDALPGRSPAYNQPGTADAPDGAWAIAYDGGELGDMCEQRSDAAYFATSLGHTIQRTWSNMAAVAMTDPCVPVPAGAVYFNSVPTLGEVIQILGADGVHTVGARGITIATGATADVPVRLFSSAPTNGTWQILAHEVIRNGQDPALRFSWDHSSGRNGDTLTLTIGVHIDIPEGRPFVLRSTLGHVTTTWVGAVVSP